MVQGKVVHGWGGDLSDSLAKGQSFVVQGKRQSFVISSRQVLAATDKVVQWSGGDLSGPSLFKANPSEPRNSSPNFTI